MNRWGKPLIVVAIAACVVAAVAFIRDNHSERHNVVLISVDTLGAKHMGCYGHFGDTSPHMDALAR